MWHIFILRYYFIYVIFVYIGITFYRDNAIDIYPVSAKCFSVLQVGADLEVKHNNIMHVRNTKLLRYFYCTSKAWKSRNL